VAAQGPLYLPPATADSRQQAAAPADYRPTGSCCCGRWGAPVPATCNSRQQKQPCGFSRQELLPWPMERAPVPATCNSRQQKQPCGFSRQELLPWPMERAPVPATCNHTQQKQPCGFSRQELLPWPMERAPVPATCNHRHAQGIDPAAKGAAPIRTGLNGGRAAVSLERLGVHLWLPAADPAAKLPLTPTLPTSDGSCNLMSRWMQLHDAWDATNLQLMSSRIPVREAMNSVACCR
jgi:hypothetical protein